MQRTVQRVAAGETRVRKPWYRRRSQSATRSAGRQLRRTSSAGERVHEIAFGLEHPLDLAVEEPGFPSVEPLPDRAARGALGVEHEVADPELAQQGEAVAIGEDLDVRPELAVESRDEAAVAVGDRSPVQGRVVHVEGFPGWAKARQLEHRVHAAGRAQVPV